jgi:hypothetical protein
MVEPSLEDVLGDEIMKPVMRSAGTDAAALRALLAELARRLPVERIRRRDERPAGCASRLSAG